MNRSRVLAILAIALVIGFGAAIAPLSLSAQSKSDVVSEVQGRKIFGNGVGFMWGTSGDQFVVARSADGGKTWKALDLGGLSPDMAAISPVTDIRKSTVYGHFEDATHGWFVWSTDESRLHIANTTDGGTTWQSALSIDSDTQVEREIFPGPGRAIVIAEMAEGMMHTTMLILATDDNGVSWTSSSLLGDGVTGLSFRNETDCFIGIEDPAAEDIFFYRSTDGGKTWNALAIRLPPTISPDDVLATEPGTAVFSGSGRLNGQLPIKLFLPAGPLTALYRTGDGGRTWSFWK